MEELEAKVKAGGLHAEWVLVGSKPTKDDVLSLMRWGEQRGQFLLRHVHYGYIPNKRDRETRDKLIEMIKNLGESLKYLRQVKTD